MKIIAFTGMPFAGKTEAVQIAHELGIPVVRMGDAVWAEVKQRGLALTDRNVGAVATEMRKRCGMDIWAQRTVEHLRSLNNTPCLVIDGIRNLEEVEYFKKEFGPCFVMIAVDASTSMRKQRSLRRKRVDDTPHSFEERDKRELSWGLGEVLASADIVIPNDSTIHIFKKKVKHVLQHI